MSPYTSNLNISDARISSFLPPDYAVEASMPHLQEAD